MSIHAGMFVSVTSMSSGTVMRGGRGDAGEEVVSLRVMSDSRVESCVSVIWEEVRLEGRVEGAGERDRLRPRGTVVIVVVVVVVVEAEVEVGVSEEGGKISSS